MSRKYVLTGTGCEVKWCGSGGHFVPVEHFWRDASRPDGLFRICQTCGNEKSLAYYYANRDKVAARYRRVRDQARAIYGGCCSECGSVERLVFHHVNGDGRKHRQVESGRLMLHRIVRLGVRLPDYVLTLLCRDCHYSLHYGRNRQVLRKAA
jgi:RNase P subunit RPR2